MTWQPFVILSLLVSIMFAAPPAEAHHGWAGNDGGEIEISGEVVSPVSLAGPHAAFQLRDADGKVWNITLAPGPRTYRAGLREGVIPVGATVTVQGARNADPEVFEAKTRRVIWEDQIFDVYPPEN